jgi:hypothetical protein
MFRLTENSCQESNFGHTGNKPFHYSSKQQRCVCWPDKLQYSWVSWHLEKAIRMATPNRNFELKYHNHSLKFTLFRDTSILMYETVQKLETDSVLTWWLRNLWATSEKPLYSQLRAQYGFVRLYCDTVHHWSNLISPVLLKECSQDALQLEMSTDSSGLRPQASKSSTSTNDKFLSSHSGEQSQTFASPICSSERRRARPRTHARTHTRTHARANAHIYAHVKPNTCFTENTSIIYVSVSTENSNNTIQK